MPRDADGNLVGDEYQFGRDGLQRLAVYFESEFTGQIVSGDAAWLEFGVWTMETVQAALTEMAAEVD